MILTNWSYFLPYFSAEYTQKYLLEKYQKLHIIDAKQKSYENCYSFIYYLEHAKTYYEQAKIAPIVIQPNLIFYGYTHLLKACILTVDPNYPDSTTVLAHGVTTRKRKKQQYQFLYDEVKIQKTGLFSLIAQKMFHMKHLEGEKFVMKELLESIPELTQLFKEMNIPTCFLPLQQIHSNELLLPNSLMDTYNMTQKRFIQYIHSTYPNLDITNNLSISINNNIFTKNQPIRYDIVSKQYQFLIKKQELTLHEILVHYLILYNLSMISRYETQWWSELLKTMPTVDYPVIISFCSNTIEKQLLLISKFLNR